MYHSDIHHTFQHGDIVIGVMTALTSCAFFADFSHTYRRLNLFAFNINKRTVAVSTFPTLDNALLYVRYQFIPVRLSFCDLNKINRKSFFIPEIIKPF